MIISHYGRGFVKLQVGETVIALNPGLPNAGFKSAKFGSQLALISLNDPAYNAIDQVTYGERVPMVVDGPGEYEFGGIFIRGFAIAGPQGKINTIYLVWWDEIRIVHLGALAVEVIPSELEEALGTIDILFVPVAVDGLSPKTAARLAVGLEPRLIVPTEAGDDSNLRTFLKEVGAPETRAVGSLTIKKKELLLKEGEVAIIQSS